MWKIRAEQEAAGLISLLASLAMIWVGPKLEGWGLGGQALALLLSGVTFYGLYSGLAAFLARRRLRHVLGKWIYFTWADQGRTQLRYGLMMFFFSEGRVLEYKVKLYDTVAQVLAASKARGGGAKMIGDANSRALRVDEQNERIYVLWEADFLDKSEPKRYGRLILHMVNENRMDGAWLSDPNAEGVSRGHMIAARPRVFEASHDELIEDLMQQGALTRADGKIVSAKALPASGGGGSEQ